jgi:hypothetical protein
MAQHFPSEIGQQEKDAVLFIIASQAALLLRGQGDGFKFRAARVRGGMVIFEVLGVAEGGKSADDRVRLGGCEGCCCGGDGLDVNDG